MGLRPVTQWNGMEWNALISASFRSADLIETCL